MFLIIENNVNLDWEAYQRFLNGDQKAFEELVIKYKDGLILFINRYVNNMHTAEDFAQDAFVEILIHRERYQPSVSFKTYLYTIGRNKAVDYIRKNSRVVYIEDYPDSEQEEYSLEEKVLKEEDKRMLYEEIKRLKKEYQIAIMLIDLEGMSYREAAGILKKSENQVKILIYRARKSLEKALRKGEKSKT